MYVIYLFIYLLLSFPSFSGTFNLFIYYCYYHFLLSLELSIYLFIIVIIISFFLWNFQFIYLLLLLLQSNFNGSNTFGTMKISSRQGLFEPMRVDKSARSEGIIRISMIF